jgi:colanic acid biosynthesis glycosyl transferase WcaI
MRLLFLNRSIYPDVTATSEVLTELCEDLVKNHRCEVTVICGRPLARDRNSDYVCSFGGRLIRTENYRGFNILRVRSAAFESGSFLRRVVNYLTYFFLSFPASFKAKRPDIVIALTDPPIIGILGLWLSFRFRIPFVICVQDLFPEASKGLDKSQSKIINFLLERTNRFCLGKASRIITLGPMMHKKVIGKKGINPAKVSIISNWVDCSKIFPAPKKNPFSLKYNIADFFVVMYIGNIGASSGLETVIYSADILRNYKDILFVFVGEGIMKDKLIELARKKNLENVKFFPNQFQDMLSYAFSSADISLILLKKGLGGYSVPSKFYKILASGKPNIACVDKESEIAEMNERFGCGLVANPQDSDDLVKKIILFYENKELGQRISENARKAAVLFDRKAGTKSYYELFKVILNGKKSL